MTLGRDGCSPWYHRINCHDSQQRSFFTLNESIFTFVNKNQTAVEWHFYMSFFDTCLGLRTCLFLYENRGFGRRTLTAALITHKYNNSCVLVTTSERPHVQDHQNPLPLDDGEFPQNSSDFVFDHYKYGIARSQLQFAETERFEHEGRGVLFTGFSGDT